MANGKIDILLYRKDQIDRANNPYVICKNLPNRPAHHVTAQFIREKGLDIKMGYVPGGYYRRKKHVY